MFSRFCDKCLQGWLPPNTFQIHYHSGPDSRTLFHQASTECLKKVGFLKIAILGHLSPTCNIHYHLSHIYTIIGHVSDLFLRPYNKLYSPYKSYNRYYNRYSIYYSLAVSSFFRTYRDSRPYWWDTKCVP